MSSILYSEDMITKDQLSMVKKLWLTMACRGYKRPNGIEARDVILSVFKRTEEELESETEFIIPESQMECLTQITIKPRWIIMKKDEEGVNRCIINPEMKEKYELIRDERSGELVISVLFPYSFRDSTKKQSSPDRTIFMNTKNKIQKRTEDSGGFGLIIDYSKKRKLQ